jgi:hypothetical protein
VVTLAAIFPPTQPPERIVAVAAAADAAGLAELWVWEDCFSESGIATATTMLAATSRVTVGIGLLPVPLRNVALSAMELATVSRLFPGRLVAGVGHGVLDWMGQAGRRSVTCAPSAVPGAARLTWLSSSAPRRTARREISRPPSASTPRPGRPAWRSTRTRMTPTSSDSPGSWPERSAPCSAETARRRPVSGLPARAAARPRCGRRSRRSASRPRPSPWPGRCRSARAARSRRRCRPAARRRRRRGG